MPLTLNNFKREIPATILTRGREYFRAGQVVDLEEDGDDGWAAVIQGTAPYEARIKRLGDKSLEVYCTCPYSDGPYCKHVAAMLYAIEEVFPEQFEGKRRKATTKRTTKLDRLRAALDAAPHQQLVDIVMETARGDREFQSWLLMQLGGTESPAEVRALVKDALRPPRGSRGFLNYWASTNAGIKVGTIVGRADEALEANPATAMTIYQIVLEEVAAALYHADDSSGVLSSNAAYAIDGLQKCAERLPPHGRADLFNYCLKTSAKDALQGWDYSWDLLGLAADLVETAAGRKALFDRLSAMETELAAVDPSDWSSEYKMSRIAEIKVVVIARLDGDEAALEFLIAHKHLTQIRAILIEYHIVHGNLDAALEVIQEGQEELAQSGGYFYGIALTYRRYLLEIAQDTGDTEAIIDHARVLWLSRVGDVYYDMMKDAIPAAEWPAYREALLSDRACNAELAAWANAHEDLWDKVRDIVLVKPHLLSPYQLEIEKRFPDETADAYQEFARQLLEGTTLNRADYREAAGYLIRMRLLGHEEEGKAAARALIEQYPQRPAMIEELKRVL